MSDFTVDNLVVGHQGQDGTLLCQDLKTLGQSWIGISRQSVDSWRFGGQAHWTDVSDCAAVAEQIRTVRPGRVFYLAAVHRSSLKRADSSISERYQAELSVNVQGVLNYLHAISQFSPNSRFVFASSSLIFAPTETPSIRLNELSAIDPRESYAVEKLLSGMACAEFREHYGIHACVAILFNHESPYRRQGFLSQYVVSSIQSILSGELEIMEIGDLHAVVDWLYAGDAVRAMIAMSDHDVPGDYVVASGVPHTVEDFLQIAFSTAGLEMHSHVRVDPERLGRRGGCRIGDASRLRDTTGWRPTMDFEELVEYLVRGAVEAPQNDE